MKQTKKKNVQLKMENVQSIGLEKLENQDNKELILKPEKIEGTPFTAVPQGNNYQIAVGRFIVLAKLFDSVEDIVDYIKVFNWELLLNTVSAYNQIIIELKLNENGK